MREADETLDRVLSVVGAHFALTGAELRQRRHKRERRIAFYLAHRMTRRSLPAIGKTFGGCSSTNVLVGIRVIEKQLAQDAVLNAELHLLQRAILSEASRNREMQ